MTKAQPPIREAGPSEKQLRVPAPMCDDPSVCDKLAPYCLARCPSTHPLATHCCRSSATPEHRWQPSANHRWERPRQVLNDNKFLAPWATAGLASTRVPITTRGIDDCQLVWPRHCGSTHLFYCIFQSLLNLMCFLPACSSSCNYILQKKVAQQYSGFQKNKNYFSSIIFKGWNSKAPQIYQGSKMHKF